MPELPEVEAARRAIVENCLGKKIKRSVVADDPKVIDGVSASDFEAALLGKTIVAAHRKGKNLWLQLDSPPFPSFQFGMAGAIYIKGVAVTKYKRSAVSDDDEWPSKYSMLFVELDDGVEFSFTDKRRFARVRLLEDPASVPPISDLGPDAFLEPMTDDEIVASLSKKKIGIKALLLQQSYISGIGNWIADEVLYQARIHPEQPAAALSRECCVTLNKCIKEVLKEAVEVGADSSQFPSNWIFHSRDKKPGKAFVDGKKIEFIKAGGRTTAYVPELQKKTGDQAAKGVSQKSNRGKGNQHVNDGNDVDELENDEDNNAEITKGKKVRKPQGQVKKKLAAKRKSDKSDEENDDDDVDELENDEDNNAETTKGKKVMKPQGQVKKKLAAKIKSDKSDEENDDDDDDDDVGELENEEDNNAETTKGKKGRKPQGQVKKKLAAKIKSDKSDEENDEDDLQGNDEDNNTETTKGKKGRKPQGQVKKKLAAKRKSDKSDEENDDDAKNKRSKKEADDEPSKAGKSKKEKLQSNQKNKKAVKKSK